MEKSLLTEVKKELKKLLNKNSNEFKNFRFFCLEAWAGRFIDDPKILGSSFLTFSINDERLLSGIKDFYDTIFEIMDDEEISDFDMEEIDELNEFLLEDLEKNNELYRYN